MPKQKRVISPFTCTLTIENSTEEDSNPYNYSRGSAAGVWEGVQVQEDAPGGAAIFPKGCAVKSSRDYK